MKMKDYILSDAYILYDNNGFFISLYRYLFSLNYRITCQYRFLRYCYINKVKIGGMVRILQMLYNLKCAKYGCCLDYKTDIGFGVRFPHNFPLVIHYGAKIGRNCIIHPGTQIGSSRTKDGVPTIGNDCFLGNGCHIIGNCRVGDNCFIAPGAFVCKDIPDGSVVGFGVNNIISTKGRECVELYLR